jgi:hypothetical protein
MTKIKLRSVFIVICIICAWMVSATTWAVDRIAASCSTADVQTAVNAAVDGDRVLIPNGSCSWTSGISTTKQIIVQAQNYTPTPGGTMTRNVTITQNSSSPLFSMQSGNSYHVGVGGIRFNEGTGDANHVRFTGSGSKVPLLYDCSMQNKTNSGNGTDAARITWHALGGVAWNIYMDGTEFPSYQDAGPSIANIAIHVWSPRAWYTPSTMGTLDTNGDINLYFEDSTFKNTGGGDIDNNARVVMRHSTFDGSIWATHGFTSLWGGRHWESYNNTYQVTTRMRNHAGAYFWSRAGTGIFTDNIVNNASFTQEYGSPSLFKIGDNTDPTGYPQPRQPGWGHDGTSNVIDPIYIWNNTGPQAYTYWFYNSAWTNNVQLNRELFVNAGAKPGYQKYTYPHPARAAIEDTTPDTTPPTTPTNLIATAQSSSQINLSWTASTDDTGIAGYDIRRCAGSGCAPSSIVHSTTGTGTTWNNTGLSASTLYRYDARARDAVPNYSSYSTIAQATTQTPADTTPPIVIIATADPTKIHISSLTVTGISSDAVGVSGCKWRRTLAPNASNGTLCTGTTSFSCATSGYSQGANTLFVGCFDAAGNYGNDSMVVNYYPPLSVPTNLRLY